MCVWERSFWRTLESSSRQCCRLDASVVHVGEPRQSAGREAGASRFEYIYVVCVCKVGKAQPT